MRKLSSGGLWALLAFAIPVAWSAAPVAAPAGAAITLSATPLPPANDLGQGLTYVLPRPNGTEGAKTFIAADEAVLPPGSIVLDLRQSKFSAVESAAWLTALQSRSASRQVCLVLVSPATPAPLLVALSTGLRGCVSVGRADPGYRPDNAVETDAASDERAGAALASGARPTDGLIENATKVRHDEVELAQAHALGKEPPREEIDLKPETPVAATSIDRVLQRAVQLHRGLVALGKLPKA